jgi:hypothetical protein
MSEEKKTDPLMEIELLNQLIKTHEKTIKQMDDDNNKLREEKKTLESGLVNLRLFAIPHDHPGQKLITYWLQKVGSVWA